MNPAMEYEQIEIAIRTHFTRPRPLHFTIWQCRDWCCDTKPHSERWWNVGKAPGDYGSVKTWRQALAIAHHHAAKAAA